MTFIKMIYSVWCTGLLAAQLTRRGRWQSATRLMNR
jgi:hypothetical protein